MEEEIEHNYLQGFINQFGDGPLGELDPEEWEHWSFSDGWNLITTK